MASNNYGGKYVAKKAGPLAFFAIIFSFFIPPIGFLMDLAGLNRDLKRNDSIGGWIFLMVISAVMTVVFIILIVYSQFFSE